MLSYTLTFKRLRRVLGSKLPMESYSGFTPAALFLAFDSMGVHNNLFHDCFLTLERKESRHLSLLAEGPGRANLRP